LFRILKIEFMKKYLLVGIFLFAIITGTQAQTDSLVWDLSRCISYAIENNLTVKQAQLNKSTSEIAYTRSKGAFLPSISASASQNYNNGSYVDGFGEYQSTSSNSTNLGANASLSFYTGGQQVHQLKQNQLLVEQNDLYVKEAMNNITLSLTQAYIQALYYREGILSAQNNVEATRKQYEQAKAKYDLGSLAAKDLADVESQLANNEYQLVAAKNSFAQQLLNLKQLLELAPEQSLEIQVPAINSEALLVPDKMDVYQKACEVMPEIQSGNLQVDISKKDLLIAKSGYYPTISLTGGLSTNYSSTKQNSFGNQMSNNINKTAGLSLNIPIFNKLNTRSSVQNAKISIDKSQIQLTSAQKELYQKIEQAWQNAISSQSELRASYLSKKASENAYKLAQQQFSLGSLSATDLLVSQNSFRNAEQKYLQTKYTSLLYYQLLQFYQGNNIKL
jgi:outer membrane protein